MNAQAQPPPDRLARARAPESLRKGRATPKEIRTWTERHIEIRTCFHCKVVYLNAGYAWRCEHWHEGL
jgi:hypothetical protein